MRHEEGSVSPSQSMGCDSFVNVKKDLVYAFQKLILRERWMNQGRLKTRESGWLTGQ